MQRRTVIASIGAIVGTSVGAAAYTSATVTRDATFTVATDSDARIGLEAGDVSGMTDNGDTFGIEVNDLNTNGEFTFGDPDAPLTTYAFMITNNDGQEHDITIKYDSPKVEFSIFKAGGTDTDFTSVGTVNSINDGTSGDTTWTAPDSAKAYAVMTVDTTDVASGSAEDSLDGTLTFTV